MRKKIILYGSILFALSFFANINNSYAQVPPPLVFPVDGSACEDVVINFDWESTVNSLDYTIQVTSVSGSYTNPEIDESGLTQSNFQATVPDYETTYFWRVAARYSNTMSWSEERTFTTKKESTSFLSPTADTKCNRTELDFTWTDDPSKSFTSYNVQIANNAGFNSPEIDLSSLNSSSYSATLTEFNKTYYARISGNYSSGTVSCVSVWSDPIQFETILKSPDLNTPADNAIGQKFNLTFNWESISGAETYDFQVSEDSDFSTFISNQTNLGANTTFVMLDDTKFNNTYYWRTKAKNTDPCESDWSETSQFKTSYPSATITSPEDDVACINLKGILFQWDAVPGASAYNILISDKDDFSTTIIDTKDIATTETTIDLPGELTEYFWKVRAEDSDNTGLWSETRSLTTGVLPPRGDYPLSDDENVFIAPEFQWAVSNDYTSMRLQVSTDPAFTQNGIFYDSSGLIDLKMEVVLPEYQTQYYWRTSTTYNNCLSGWSDVSSFTSFNGFPNLELPVNNATNQKLDLRLSWEDVQKRTSFDISIAKDPTFETVVEGTTGLESNNYYPSKLKSATKYYWRVRTRNAYPYDKQESQSVSPWSPAFMFTTGLGESESPVLVYPEYQETKIPVNTTLNWLRSDDAQSYQVQFSSDELFNTTILDTTEVKDTLVSVGNLDNYKRYYWRVKSMNITDTSDWSDSRWFRTIAPMPANAPLLETPENEKMDQSFSEAFFQWSTVDNIASIDEGTYELIVVKGTDFDVTENILLGTTTKKTSKSAFELDPETLYSWRVLARNEAGDSDWSEIWTFTTNANSVADGKNYFDTKIYPNPASDLVSIRVNLKTITDLNVQLFSTEGKLIKTFFNNELTIGNNILNLKLGKMTPGSYILKINSHKNAEAHKIIIK